ncbi:hypothetical protein [Mesonia sp. K7]|uniref:hypothetical protein n=1 Tax=Mesonia sp. K7 TaxID=2218606 RepID=UPI000DA70A6F|nr:hypothetical protein [Mesonia sp. K7]PZD79674.1 hypothetical protein DNG35_01330 [Mesonia sp. K7]
MKNPLKIFVCFSLFLILSCQNDDNNSITEVQKKYLVDRIYDYNHNLLAVYHYNENNQLIKRVTTDPTTDRSSDYEFEYVEGKISKIIYIDYNFPQFNHQIKIFYNEEGHIYKQETYKNEYLINTVNYTYDADGKLTSFTSAEQEPLITFMYDNTQNIMQTKVRYPDDGSIANKRKVAPNRKNEYIEVITDYTYDSYHKPDFGIGKIFQFEPLPYFGTEALLEKNYSENNMTSNGGSGTKWIYTYNENNLPKTIETKWHEIETEEPMLLRIVYKEILIDN